MRSMVLHHQQQGREDSISSDQSNLTVDSEGISRLISSSSSKKMNDYFIEGNLENEWVVWNKLVNQWPMYMKKKSIWIRVKSNEKKNPKMSFQSIGFNSFGCTYSFPSIIVAMFD